MMNKKRNGKIIAGLMLGLLTFGAVMLTPITAVYAAGPDATQNQPIPPDSTNQTPTNPPPSQSGKPPIPNDDGHSSHH